LNEPAANAMVRTAERERAGGYSAPLPSPAGRKGIREQADRTQRQIAAELGVSRHTLAKWEEIAGWDGDRELWGREPPGEVRPSYADLLTLLDNDPQLAR
jgi:hypothetical protein